MEKTEALAQFGGDKSTQGDVIDQHDQQNLLGRLRGGRGHGDVVDDHRDLALKVNAPVFAGQGDVFTRPQEAVRAALIHQRIAPEARRQRRAARAAHQFNVIDIGRTVGPLKGARQRRAAGRRIEGDARRAVRRLQ